MGHWPDQGGDVLNWQTGEMALFKVAEFNPNYRDALGGRDLKGLEVCTAEGEKIGTVADALVDEMGRFQYLIVDMGFWIFGKQVLLPIGRASLDHTLQRVYIYDLTKSQAETLPTYAESQFFPESGTIPPSLEKPNVSLETQGPLEHSAPLEMPRVRVLETPPQFEDQPPLESPSVVESPLDRRADLPSIEEVDAAPFISELDPDLDRELYRQLHEADPEEARSSISPRTLGASSPLGNRDPSPFSDRDLLVFLNRADLHSGEVVRVALYAEETTIRKKVGLRETVRLRKQVITETIDAEAELRREALDISTEGHPTLHSSKNFGY